MNLDQDEVDLQNLDFLGQVLQNGGASFHVGGGHKSSGGGHKKKGKKKLMNLDETTAIVATPAEALTLLNMNNQLENPYEVKGAFLIWAIN